MNFAGFNLDLKAVAALPHTPEGKKLLGAVKQYRDLLNRRLIEADSTTEMIAYKGAVQAFDKLLEQTDAQARIDRGET